MNILRKILAKWLFGGQAIKICYEPTPEGGIGRGWVSGEGGWFFNFDFRKKN